MLLDQDKQHQYECTNNVHRHEDDVDDSPAPDRRSKGAGDEEEVEGVREPSGEELVGDEEGRVDGGGEEDRVEGGVLGDGVGEALGANGGVEPPGHRDDGAEEDDGEDDNQDEVLGRPDGPDEDPFGQGESFGEEEEEEAEEMTFEAGGEPQDDFESDADAKEEQQVAVEDLARVLGRSCVDSAASKRWVGVVGRRRREGGENVFEVGEVVGDVVVLVR